MYAPYSASRLAMSSRRQLVTGGIALAQPCRRSSVVSPPIRLPNRAAIAVTTELSMPSLASLSGQPCDAIHAPVMSGINRPGRPARRGSTPHRAQRLAAARAGHAFAAAQFEAGAMRSADQQAVLALEELARRPVEAAAGMRADVEPRPHVIAITIQDQRIRHRRRGSPRPRRKPPSGKRSRGSSGDRRGRALVELFNEVLTPSLMPGPILACPALLPHCVTTFPMFAQTFRFDPPSSTRVRSAFEPRKPRHRLLRFALGPGRAGPCWRCW